VAGKVTQKDRQRITTMNRAGLIRMLRRLDCDFELDFTDEFLADISLPRLRHIVLSASLHAHKGVQTRDL